VSGFIFLNELVITTDLKEYKTSAAILIETAYLTLLTNPQYTHLIRALQKPLITGSICEEGQFSL